MQRDFRVVESNRLSELDCSYPGPGLQPSLEHTDTGGGGEIRPASPSSVVAVGMRNDSTIDWLPWIDEEVTGLAVQASIGEGEQRHNER
jgi:hypothetical protein